MPRPVRPSRMTTIGFSAPSSAFTCRTPRQSARKPPSELAVPRSTAKSVRFTATLPSSARGSSVALADATTSDAAAGAVSGPLLSALASTLASAILMSAALASAGLMSDSLASAALAASINFGAAGSGGPMIDLLISEAAVADAAEFGEVVAVVARPAFAGPAMLAIAPVPDASDLPVSARLSGAVEAAVVVATGARTGAEAGDCVAALCCGACGVPAGNMEACAAAAACGPADTEGVAV